MRIKKKRALEFDAQIEDLGKLIVKLKEQASERILIIKSITEMRNEVRDLKLKYGFSESLTKIRATVLRRAKKGSKNKAHKDSSNFVGATLK